MTVLLGRRAFWLLLAALAVLLTVAPAGQAQRTRKRPFGEGTDYFRHILHTLQMKPLNGGEQLEQDPAHSLLIVLGDPGRLLGKRLRPFLDNGGALLFASDQAVSDEDLRKEIASLSGWEIVGKLVHIPAVDPATRECPILVPGAGANPDLPDLFHLTREPGEPPLRVMTNRPSYLQRVRNQPGFAFRPLATLPEPCQVTILNRFGDFDRPEILLSPIFAVGGPGSRKGRFLLLADHSIFINMMLPRPDAGNLEFTSNCLEYLRDPQGARRDRVLLLDEGQVNSNFDVPLTPVPEPSVPSLRALLATVDQRLAHLEDQDAFNQTLVRELERRGINQNRLFYAVVILLTVLLLAYLVWRLMRAVGQRPEQDAPQLTEITAESPPGPLLEQRQREILKTGNLWENARQVARQMFLSAGVAVPVDPRHAPPIRTAGGLWQRWRRQRQVRRLWRLAFDPRPIRVRPRQWPDLLAQLDQLRADLINGTVQVERAA